MTKTTMQRTAVILAAGYGSRLADYLPVGTSKPMASIGDASLIIHTLHSLELVCDQAIIVTGYQALKVRSHIDEHYHGALNITFVYNDQHHLANGVSLLKARKILPEEFILTMADHLMEDDVVLMTAGCRPPAGGATLLLDYKTASILDLDDATKVLEKNKKIVAISKNLAEYNCIDTGIFVCTSGLLDALAEVYRVHGDASLSDGVQLLADQGKMTGVDIGDGFWQDVDTVEMLKFAEKKLFPKQSHFKGTEAAGCKETMFPER